MKANGDSIVSVPAQEQVSATEAVTGKGNTAVWRQPHKAVPDTVAPDTVPASEGIPALVLNPAGTSSPELTSGKGVPQEESPWGLIGSGGSIVTLGLFLLFCVLGICFHNNPRYLAAIRRDLFEIRERGNVFDDTVRETAFLLVMNLLWIASAGVLLAYGVRGYEAGWAQMVGWSPGWLRVVGCMGVAAVYTLFMWFAYTLTGNVFADSQQTGMWIRAFAAAQGLTGVGFFVIAIAVECYPDFTQELLIAAGVIFIIFRLIFIFKRIQIFFNKFSSWMIFLCYLCNLEIVPLILTFVAGVWICHAT